MIAFPTSMQAPLIALCSALRSALRSRLELGVEIREFFAVPMEFLAGTGPTLLSWGNF